MYKCLVFLSVVCVCVCATAQSIYSVDPQTVPYDETIAAEVSVEGNKSTVVYASNSVLSSGKWYKVKVNSTGMMRLSKTMLAKMGFSDMSKVSVYGNGGERLEYANKSFRIDDLARVKVYRTDDGVLFYAKSGDRWLYSDYYNSYTCKINEYDKDTYYYITDSQTPSESPAIVYQHTCEVTDTTDVYVTGVHHELSLENLLKSGVDWLGEKISGDKPSKTVTLDVLPRDVCDTVYVRCRLVGRSGSEMPYSLYYNDELLFEDVFSAVSTSSTTSSYGSYREVKEEVITSDDTRNEFRIEFKPNQSTDCVWIDYITVSSTANLDMEGKDELMFRVPKTFTAKQPTRLDENPVETCLAYEISGADESTVVWKVNDYNEPVVMPASYKDGKLMIFHDRGVKSEFVAFNPNGVMREPELVGVVENQNLHGLSPVNYVIVYHPDFKEQAERLADLHRKHSGISVAAVNVNLIYNEFASGRTEPTAIRDFLRMMYKRGASTDNDLRYALLFGDGSYDNRKFANDPSNKIPTYQSAQSLIQSDTYVTDDFFGWLGDSDGSSDWGSRMDIGIGRFPVQTLEEAKQAVDKSEAYILNRDYSAWKNSVVVVADDGDECEHIEYAEVISDIVESEHVDLNVKRIYLETYAAERTSTGIVYPKAHDDFMSSVNNGCLVLNYVGHGGHNALTDEGLFKQKDIYEWSNIKRLPFFITATCDFTPFDKNDAFSAGEESFLYPHGGFVGLFTTTRLVYGSSNNKIHKAMCEYLLEENENGRRYTIGEASMLAKVKAGGMTNSFKYVLIGDPAITLRYGDECFVATDSVNGEHIDVCETSIAALRQNTINGSVRDANGNICSGFNGQVFVTLYDKRVNKTMTGPVSGSSFQYEDNGSILYSGLVNVTNGLFESSFILSKDINFEVGHGKVSYYAVSTDSIEAVGSMNTILVGGVSEQIMEDVDGPTIEFWADYPEFVNGGETGPNPIVYAVISDESGINVSGLGVGHNISIYVDNDRVNAINVNEYFEYDLGSYTSGKLAFPMPTLSDGKHVITIKAWDNLNNSSIKEIEVNSSVRTGISFGEKDVYPLPFLYDSSLKLSFSHNCGGGSLKLTMSVYGINGQMLTTSQAEIVSSGNKVDDIVLTDLIPEIKNLSSGMYFLRVEINGNNRKGSFVKKIAIKAQ